MITSKELVRVRERLKVSQIKLAKNTGVSRYRIYLFENGYQHLELKELKLIRNYLEKCKHRQSRGQRR